MPRHTPLALRLKVLSAVRVADLRVPGRVLLRLAVSRCGVTLPSEIATS